MNKPKWCPFSKPEGMVLCTRDECAIWDEKRECCSFKTTPSQIFSSEAKEGAN